MTKWKGLLGPGSPPTAAVSKRLLHRSRWDRTQRTGEKNGSKRHIQVDERGVPLSLVVSAANPHDSTKLEALLAAKVTQAPEATEENLCLDAAYVGKEAVATQAGYTPHIRPRGEEKLEIERNPEFKPRRWVVELTHSWFNRFRKLCPRYEKTDLSFLGLTMLAAAMITLNKVITIYG